MQAFIDRLPVLIGIGEITVRSKDAADALEPIELMARALERAALDAGLPLDRIDSLDIVCEVSWPYADAPGLLCERLGIEPARAVYGEIGGESPVRFIHEAALRIAAGESEVAVVTGAEAQYSVSAAKRAGVDLPWAARDEHPTLIRGKDFLSPLALKHGVATPANVYPFYENASFLRWGQSPREAMAESADLWSRFSAIAAANPNAWLRKAQSPAEVATPTEANRMIAWPYTKAMVANPFVNMGAAVLLTSRSAALAMGVPEERLVYVRGGAAAREPRDYLERDQYRHSHAQDVVLESVLRLIDGDRLDAAELYSCFPVVPKMARRVLGLAKDAQLTSTGGLSFFGAPLNNYMTHAACGLVRALRQAPGKLALLYGQGEFVTKHHAIVLASAPPSVPLERDYSVQAQADARRGGVPPLVLDYGGPARIETFTILYDRGIPHAGVVVGLTPDGRRLMARVEPEDALTMAALVNLDRSPIGLGGQVTRGSDDLLRWALDL